jgi:hypothetical protein
MDFNTEKENKTKITLLFQKMKKENAVTAATGGRT